MFDRILIANRGEIACRIMRTAQHLGIECVAVYSDADANAMHVQMADVAVHIGGSAPADSYLRGDVIVAAALDTGAQAIHPGYGFLSENPEFVRTVQAAGLTFVGPSADAIEAMGLKDAAKALMEKAGVPIVPGYHGADQSDERLIAAADETGFPLLIKAVAGGGGKGMRRVDDPAQMPQALASARSEAKNAFGNSDVLIEKYIQQPRHIEVQVFGDGKEAIHLFERDCSLQRRHQKVIEEAPAPGMTEAVRSAMGQAAVRAAQAIGYSGAGTVEFIVDGSDGLSSDGFFFMEMNTRLQVEHPVTEAITGVDLVEWQLRVASGEPLPAGQDDIKITGHAFEARLYAEDVAAGFLPASGRLSHLAFPQDVRADSGVRAGDEISPWYDPMIAKLVVHGATRQLALSKLRLGLAGVEVAGSVTNLGFLGALASHQGFADECFDTGLIERDLDLLTAPIDVAALHWVAAGLVALGLTDPPKEAGFTLWQPLRQRVSLRFGEEAKTLTVQVLSQHTQCWQMEDEEILIERRQGGWWCGKDRVPRAVSEGFEITVLDAYGLSFSTPDPLAQTAAETDDGNMIEAPMPGVVREIAAVPGQHVVKGERLAILEAMKMEHVLIAVRDGLVAEIYVSAGDQVSAGTALVRLEDVA